VPQTTRLRVGVDVGGTFTDVIAVDEVTGSTALGKRPTVSDDPAGGVIRTLEDVVGGSAMREVAQFAHGTTVALNAILEQRGARVGMLCTNGFRDVLELRRGTRQDAFNLLWKPPDPLVARHLRVAVRERILADGTVLTPLVEEDVERGLAGFLAAEVESVAIAFINSWINPDHERLAARILRQLGFAGEITLSHELTQEYREFERSSTAAINAYVQPKIARYLAELEGGLEARGVSAELHLMRSGGGTMSFPEAAQRPFEMISSGPVAGAEAAAHVARELGLAAAISADVGGTSFDACLILDGRSPLLTEGYVGGLPVQTSWVDVRSIGAGGGSIARLDAGRLLRVGPGSAGSNPGPASYGLGGREPTVTDAAALLGLLGDGSLGGNVQLELGLARRALEPLAQALGLAAEEAARGILAISAAAMASAIREITIEKGYDPRDAALVAFGGAGPMFATMLAEELDIRLIVVPPVAGNFSAWGLLKAEVTREAARTFLRPLSEQALKEASEEFTGLFSRLSSRLDSNEFERQSLVDLRYRGQEHTLTIPLPNGNGSGSAPTLSREYRRAYRQTYFHELDADLELVALRVRTRRQSRPLPWPAVQPERSQRPHGHRTFSFKQQRFLEFAILDRSSLSPSGAVAGPAIITEGTATTYLDCGFAARVDATGCLLLERVEP
jgi:N-methylhydantoinase A